MNNKEIAEYARQIAAELQEKNTRVNRLIFDVITHLGLEATQGYVQKAQSLHTEGGMLTIDGSQQRTLGGIFFKLLKDDLDPEVRKRIFYENPRLHQKAKKAKQAQSVGENTTSTAEKPKPPKKAKTQPVMPTGTPTLPPMEIASDIPIPDGLSELDAAKYEELYHVASSLRERIGKAEAAGQTAGLKTLKMMLNTTEAQLRVLEGN